MIQIYFLKVTEAEKSKIKYQSVWFLVKLSLAVDGAISLCAHKTSLCADGGVADGGVAERERANSLVVSLLKKGTNPSLGPILVTSSNPSNFLEAPSPTTVTLGG